MFRPILELVTMQLTLIRSEAAKLFYVTMRGTDRTLCIYRLFARFVSGHIDIHRRVCTLVFVCLRKCLLTRLEPRLLIVQECVYLSCTDQADAGRYEEPNLAPC